jgi:drug/metabolite transporter (DMT)-like permease
VAKALFAISIVTLLWAANFTAGKIGTSELSPYFIASVRVFMTAAVFYAFLPRDQRRIDRADLKAVLPLALSGIAINQTAFAAGIALTTPSHSAIIHALIPVTVAVFAWILIREKIGPVAMLGLALAVAGALVVVLGAPREEMRGTIAGDLLTLVGMVAFSLYTVLGRRLLANMGSARAVTFAFVVAVPFMVPVFVIGLLRQDWARVTWRGWAALGYMVVFATLICYALHLFALTRLKTGQVAIFTDLQPALGTGIAVLAGQDRLTELLVIGGAIALAGVALVQMRR